MSHQTGIQGNGAGAACGEGAPGRPPASREGGGMGRAGVGPGPQGVGLGDEPGLCASPRSRVPGGPGLPSSHPGPAVATLLMDPKFAGAKEMAFRGGRGEGGVPAAAAAAVSPTFPFFIGLGRPGTVEAIGALFAVERRANFLFHGLTLELLQDLDYQKKDTGIFFISSKGASQTLPHFLPKRELLHRCLYPEYEASWLFLDTPQGTEKFDLCGCV